MPGAGICNCELWVCLFTYVLAGYQVNNTQTLVDFQSQTRQITGQFTLAKGWARQKGPTKMGETNEERGFMVFLSLTFGLLPMYMYNV